MNLVNSLFSIPQQCHTHSIQIYVYSVKPSLTVELAHDYQLSILILTAVPPPFPYTPLLSVPLGLAKLTVPRNDMYS